MAVKYKDLEEAGRTGTIREITDYEMVHGLPEGYDTLERYSPYQPDDVAGRGNWGVGDNAFMSEDDWNAVQGYKQNWANAETDEERAYWHDMAQQVRYGYGYSGGADGSKYNTVVANTAGMPSAKDNNKGYGSNLNYANAGQYVSQWQDQINALTGAILGREAFSYNKDTDPLYQQYAESYTRGGQRGMQDTLAQVSARTGGLASSYAQSAAQQTYNNYMAALADKVPELQRLAYSMYMDDIAMDRADLDMLMGLDDRDYGRWSDDRNFNYGAYRDSVADAQWQQNFNYQQAQDALAQKNWQTQWDYNVLQDELARQDALAKLYASSGNGKQTEPTLSLAERLQNMTPAEAEMYLIENNYSSDDIDRVMARMEESWAQQNTVDSTEGLDLLREMEKDGASVEDLHDMLTELYRNGLITEEAYNRRLDRYRIN